MAPKNTLPMMPFFVRDHIAATRHMSLAERGAYTDLLFQSWDSGSALPKDLNRLASMVGVSPKEFKAIWPAIQQKLLETEHGYISERLEAERQKARHLKSKASEKAATAAAARWSHAPGSAMSNAPSKVGALLEECPPSPSPSIKPPDSDATVARKRARPAGPNGLRARPEVVNENDPEIQRRRREAQALCGHNSQGDSNETPN